MNSSVNEQLDIRKELETITDLPTLPHVIVQLMSYLDEPDVEFKRIAQIIQEDPPLVAQMLKIVNSGFYGLPNSIDDLHQALVILGLDEIQTIVFADSVYSIFYNIHENDFFDYQLFWQHSIGTARLGYALASLANLPQKRTVYTAGLLHDIGRLVIQLYFPEHYRHIFAIAHENQLDLLTAEVSHLNFTHTEAGYWIAEKWNLPDTLKDVILNHHNLDEETITTNPINTFIYIANEFARLWGNTLEVTPVTISIENTELWHHITDTYPSLKSLQVKDLIQFVDLRMEEADAFVQKLKQTRTDE